MTAEHGQAAGVEFDPATREVMRDQWVTRLHLLRHGAVARLEQRVVRGQADEPLSDEGRLQSRQLARWLAEHEPAPDRIVGSDLGRCRELGLDLAARVQLEYESDVALREQDMGRWQGRTWAAVTEADAELVKSYWDDYVHTAPPGGESFAELVERAAGWWRSTADACVGRRLWVVTHVGVIRALTSTLLGLPPEQALRLAPATASHTSFLVSAAGAVLTSFGERPWLFGGELER